MSGLYNEHMRSDLRRAQESAKNARARCQEAEGRLEDLLYWVEERAGQEEKRNAEANRKWREANPEKWAAHVAVELALRRGALVRPDHCPECGRSGVIHAHHHDYDKPLDIEWLCPTCHKARHSAEVDPCA